MSLTASVLVERSPYTTPSDLRSATLGAVAWVGSLVGLTSEFIWRELWCAGWVAALLVAALLAGRRALRNVDLRPRRHLLHLCALNVAALGSCGVALMASHAVTHSTVATLATEAPVVKLDARVVSDPRRVRGQFGDVVVLRVRSVQVQSRGRSYVTRAPIVLFAKPSHVSGVALDERVSGWVRLSSSDNVEAAAFGRTQSVLLQLSQPRTVFTAAQALRDSIRHSARAGPGSSDHLVPALVMGDDASLPEPVVEDFRVSGLTHLTAVSGTNLTLLLAAVLPIAALCGVGRRGRWVVALVTIAGFVVLARPEPSVLRAATMGAIGLWSLRDPSTAGRALGAAVVVLLLANPFLAHQPGFALSVLATAGIVWIAPSLAAALEGWLPRPLALAIAVPTAAQLTCTPVIAALSGQVSMVAVLANLCAAPAVAPATILGLVAGVIGLVPGTDVLVVCIGWCAGLAGWWLIAVAQVGASAPGAAWGWATDTQSLGLLTALCAAGAVCAPAVLRKPRWIAAACIGTLTVAVFVHTPRWWNPLSRSGWGSEAWVLAMCDVGQGDALVAQTAPGEAVLFDVGPEAAGLEECLDRLDISSVPVVVLSHFHADHVAGLAGLLAHHEVREIVVSPLPDPAAGAEEVHRLAQEHGVRIGVPEVGEHRAIGNLRWQMLSPTGGAPGAVAATNPNDASLVFHLHIEGVSVLMTGDIEPQAQRNLRTNLGNDLGQIDVLKVPHHGSAYQDLGFLTGLAPRVALVSVGADNDYGHPNAQVLDALAASGALVRRTDVDGDVLVVKDEGGLRLFGQRD